jgi:protein-disulfide isomerase
MAKSHKKSTLKSSQSKNLNSSRAKPKNRRQQRLEQKRARRQRQRLTNIAVFAAVLLAAGLYILWPRPEALPVAQARLDDNPSEGPKDAPVVLTEFGDFGCPACRAWHNSGIIDQILRQYEGQIQFEWKDFPVITARSPKAAEAGQCAYDQDMFWEYHDYVYEQPGNVVDLSEQALKRYADEVGLNMEVFNACLESGQHERTVQVDRQDAMNLGLRGTPSFLINGRPVLGGQPELIIQAIDEALSSQ